MSGSATPDSIPRWPLGPRGLSNERTPLREISNADVRTPLSMKKYAPRHLGGDEVVKLLEAQLSAMNEAERAREVQARRALEVLETSSRQARDNAEKIRSTLNSLTDMEEFRREAEVARLEATEARKLKNSLLKRIARQAEAIMQADADRAILRETCSEREQLIISLEASLQESRTVSSHDQHQCELLDSGEPLRAQLSNERATFRQHIIELSVSSVITSVVDDVARSIDKASVPSRNVDYENWLKAEVDRLSEFVAVEAAESRKQAEASEKVAKQLREKLVRAEEHSKKLEEEIRSDNRKYSKKIEALERDLQTERCKLERNMEECRRYKDMMSVLEEEKNSTSSILIDLRRQYTQSVETARKEVRSRKEELEKERRRAEDLAYEKQALVVQLKQKDNDFDEVRRRADDIKERLRESEVELVNTRKKCSEAEGKLKTTGFENHMLRADIDVLKSRAEMGEEAGNQAEMSKLKEEALKLKGEADQYKMFARRYKEKMDAHMKALTTQADAARDQLKKHWTLVSRHPELQQLTRIILERSDVNPQDASTKGRRMSVV
mmetsp:Transcript_1243/g.3840  ORF Transcript_1243/g.3840 Transcript_1243/m.3840 type:complete len:556 (-) Transcript_1243:1519-3186(-)